MFRQKSQAHLGKHDFKNTSSVSLRLEDAVGACVTPMQPTTTQCNGHLDTASGSLGGGERPRRCWRNVTAPSLPSSGCATEDRRASQSRTTKDTTALPAHHQPDWRFGPQHALPRCRQLQPPPITMPRMRATPSDMLAARLAMIMPATGCVPSLQGLWLKLARTGRRWPRSNRR